MQSSQNDLRPYSIKPITQDQADKVFSLFKSQYAVHQPLMEAYCYQFTPQRRSAEVQAIWDEQTKSQIKDILSKNLSIGCFDLKNNEELIGAALINDALKRDASGMGNFLKQELFKTVPKKYLQIIQSQSCPFVEHWLFCIQNLHTGKGLLKMIVNEGNKLAKQKKYQYSVCWSSNFKSAKTLEGLGYELVGQTNAKQFVFEGNYPFKHLRQEHKMQTLWFTSL